MVQPDIHQDSQAFSPSAFQLCRNTMQQVATEGNVQPPRRECDERRRFVARTGWRGICIGRAIFLTAQGRRRENHQRSTLIGEISGCGDQRMDAKAHIIQQIFILGFPWQFS